MCCEQNGYMAVVLHNCFFGFQPNEPASRQMDGVARRLVRTRCGLGRPMSARRRHVSLSSLGVDDRPMDDRARRGVEAVAGLRAPAFQVAFNRIASFSGGGDQRALVLRGDEGVLGVDLLQAAIHGALAEAGLVARRLRPFEAHLTLVRGRDRLEEVFIRPIAWTVREFVLIHSYVGETRYEVAGRFPLLG